LWQAKSCKGFKGKINDLAQDQAMSAEFFDQKTFDAALEVGTRVEINGKEAQISLQTKNARGFAGAFFYTTLSKARYYGGFPENKGQHRRNSSKAGLRCSVCYQKH
jgi:putative ABC transport system permease protein